MKECLEFKPAKCKDCYKCLRACPVKAIGFKQHRAELIESRCILCGQCAVVCPQHAIVVHSHKDDVLDLLKGPAKVVATVEPSFIASFGVKDFSQMKAALRLIGFEDAEESARGAIQVTKKYRELMESGQFKNFITSSCPSVCKLIQLYFPQALPYLAPVDSPMIAHAKILKQEHPEWKIVSIGPCIAKRQSAVESGIIDDVLTFEELEDIFAERGIEVKNVEPAKDERHYASPAKYYPICQGIIKSFETPPENFHYLSVTGQHCLDALRNMDSVQGVFAELHTCRDGCVNGPCHIPHQGGNIKAAIDVLNYVNDELEIYPRRPEEDLDIDFTTAYRRLDTGSKAAGEDVITEILSRTNRNEPSKRLDCGACGYTTCAQKAWAVHNGYCDTEVCVPFMRKRAESLSYDVIQHSPEGIIVLNKELIIMEINDKAKEMLGISDKVPKGLPAGDLFSTAYLRRVLKSGESIVGKRILLEGTNRYAEISISPLRRNNSLFCIMKDITDMVKYGEKVNDMKMNTLRVTDEVIKKQMRVAQEIASLLGETTAETKVALLQLKDVLLQDMDN